MTKRQKVLTLVVLVAVFTVVGLDALSPVLLRRQLTDVASHAATAAGRRYLATGSSSDAAVAARAVTDGERVVLTRFEVLNGGAIRVTVSDDADSYVLGHVRPLHGYYTVDASATAAAPAGAPPPATSTSAP